MKIGLIIIGVVILFFIIKAIFPFGQKPAHEDISRPSVDKKPVQEKPNDKLVVVRDADYDNLKKALIEFCNMYNKESFQAQPRLVKVSDREFAITFPYDINFEIFCYLVNYIEYPMDIKWQPTITAWTTTKQTDKWVSDKSVNKKVMLFIEDNDNEHDNVFMTTEDNIGFKLGFAVGEEKQPLNSPNKKFVSPSVEFSVLTDKPAENFQ